MCRSNKVYVCCLPFCVLCASGILGNILCQHGKVYMSNFSCQSVSVDLSLYFLENLTHDFYSKHISQLDYLFKNIFFIHHRMSLI